MNDYHRQCPLNQNLIFLEQKIVSINLSIVLENIITTSFNLFNKNNTRNTNKVPQVNWTDCSMGCGVPHKPVCELSVWRKYPLHMRSFLRATEWVRFCVGKHVSLF